LIARGDTMLDDVEVAAMPSELPGVSAEAWAAFVRGMSTAPAGAVSKANALGMFELTPRRLADLGLVKGLTRSRSGQRTVWVAEFVAPMTSHRFLTNPRAQYAAFVKSMRDYADKIAAGELVKPADMSLSGALAILHRGGPRGLENWTAGERFAPTQAAYDRVSEVF
jgi:hypothetical protein